MNPEPDPAIVTVRYSKTTSVGVTSVGTAIIVAWAVQALNGAAPAWVLFSLPLILAGINSFFRPFGVYDTRTGNLEIPAIIGPWKQQFGPANREMLSSNGKRLTRIGYNGKIRPLSTLTANRADAARLLTAVARPTSEDRWKQRERRRT